MNTPPDPSATRIKWVAAAIWLSGAIVLGVKGSSLLLQAVAMQPESRWAWLVIPAGLLIGGIKTVFIFEKACRRNLDRIALLDDGRIWQAYRPGFYFFLALMILFGGTLSRLAHGSYSGLIAVALLDFSLATALLGGGRLFWTHRPEHGPKADDKER